jgi:hypothetical protein
VARVPITFEGQYLGDLHVPPVTNPALVARAKEQIAQLAALPEWSKLGTDLAARGPHRLAIAARAATAAATGGRGVLAEEEDRIAQWFGGIVDEAIRRGGLPAAAAIWVVLAGDSHDDPLYGRSARCPAFAAVPPPPEVSFELGEPDAPGAVTPDPDEVAAFLAKLRAAAPGYVYTAIACASGADLHDLREIMGADAHAIEEFRPWGVELAAETPASELLEDARAILTYRQLSNAEACGGVADWAHGFAAMVAEHALPPVLRIGAVAWLARVALRPADDAASVTLSSAGDAACVLLRPAEDAAPGDEQGAQGSPARSPARSLVQHCVALEAAGWHVVTLRPSDTDEPLLWRVTIERHDEAMTMTMSEVAEPDAALAELVRYVQEARDDG